MPNITPIGAACCLCGEKTVKIAPLTELNTAACTSRCADGINHASDISVHLPTSIGEIAFIFGM